jgi:hypothetical protein
MGLKFFREETKHDVLYYCPEYPEGVRFTLKAASARGRRRILNQARANSVTGGADIAIGSWNEAKLTECVSGWDEAKVGRPFNEEALLSLDVPIENFLIKKIDELELTGLATREEGAANPTKTSPTSA